MLYHIYILECADGTLYTGITTNLLSRIEEHNSGKGAKYTRGRTPVKLFYSEFCKSRSEACRREHEIKKMSRKRKRKLAGYYE